MRQRGIVGLLAVCLPVIQPLPAMADEATNLAALTNQPVQVVLVDGRTPRGILSPRTGADWLVLTGDLPGIAIESRFAWPLVRTIEQLPVDAPGAVDDADGEPRLDNGIPPAPIPAEAELPPWSARPPVHGALPFEPSLDLLPFDLRRVVRSLRIEATVANWDRDAEVDGLSVRVQPLDGWGQVVPVMGNLDVQLVTETKLVTGGQSISRDDSFRITERWSTPIHAIDFDATGAIVNLPFRRFHPERHFDIAPDALAFARLRLPSAGAFDASDSFVVLRPASRFRDDLQLDQNRRLLPFEGPPRW